MSEPMSDLLQRIADDRRRAVAARKLEVPAHLLRPRIPPAPTAGRLERALRRGGPAGAIRVIAEVKRASPSRGVLDVDVNPVARAALYEAGGAAAVSLVIEPEHFQGDPAWLELVRPAVRVPILAKDFIVDGYQLIEAAAFGADAVLLIAAMTSEIQMQRAISDARLLGLDCLVEVHDEGELSRAVRAGATVVGINNRDLRTFEVSRETALALLPLVPPLVTAVVESGISGPDDLAPLRATRCDAVLVGEALMTSPDPARALAGLVAAARG